MDSVARLRELQRMLNEQLISQDEYGRLRAEVLHPQAAAMGNTGRPFSLPVEPLRPRVTFRNPVNGATVTISKDAAFWLTFIFGCFYLAYKEARLHAGIAALIAIVTGPLWLIFWFVYAFFAYRIIVDSYRRKGWIEVGTQ